MRKAIDQIEERASGERMLKDHTRWGREVYIVSGRRSDVFPSGPRNASSGGPAKFQAAEQGSYKGCTNRDQKVLGTSKPPG